MLAEHLQKTKKEYKTIKKQGFQNDMVRGSFNDLPRRRVSDKYLRDKAFNIAKNPKHDGYQRTLVPIVYKFFDKNSTSLADKSTSGGVVKSKIMSKCQTKN